VWRRRNGGELPLIIGHRGASAVESENSVAAFARARADGADGVELDAMICGTGEVVVFHDDDLARLGGRPERIGETSFAVLRGVPDSVLWLLSGPEGADDRLRDAAREAGVDMPVTEAVCALLDGAPVGDVIGALLSRPLRGERE